MTYLNGIEESDEDEKFVRGLLNYVDDEIKSDNKKNIVLSM